MIYQHILYCTDLSEESFELAKKAKQIAELHHAKLSLFHCIEYSTAIYGGGEFAIPPEFDLEEAMRDKAEKSLKKQGADVGVPSENLHIDVGAPKKVITEWAKKHSVDCLVCGTHGRHGLGLILGSTANAILHHAPCDVLAIRVFD